MKITNFEAILLIIIVIHIIISFLQYLRAKTVIYRMPGNNFLSFIVGLDDRTSNGYSIFKFFSVVFVIASFLFVFYHNRADDINVVYDINGNAFIYNQDNFTISDSKNIYDINNDTIYLSNKKIGYIKKYKTNIDYSINGLDNEPKLFSIMKNKTNYALDTKVLLSDIISQKNYTRRLNYKNDNKHLLSSIDLYKTNNIKIEKSINLLQSKIDSLSNSYKRNNQLITVLVGKLK